MRPCIEYYSILPQGNREEHEGGSRVQLPRRRPSQVGLHQRGEGRQEVQLHLKGHVLALQLRKAHSGQLEGAGVYLESFHFFS